MEQLRILFIILGVSAVIVGIQYLFYRFTKVRFLIYSLPLLALLATLYFIIYAYWVPLEGFASLGYFVMAMLAAGVFIVSLIAALVLDFMKRRRAKKS